MKDPAKRVFGAAVKGNGADLPDIGDAGAGTVTPKFSYDNAVAMASGDMGDTLWEGEVYDIAVPGEWNIPRVRGVWDAVVAKWAQLMMKHSGRVPLREAARTVLLYERDALVAAAKEAGGRAGMDTTLMKEQLK